MKFLLNVMVAVVCCVAVICFMTPDEQSFESFDDVLRYVREAQPESLDLGDVDYSLEQLEELKSSLPENAYLAFRTNFGGTMISDRDTEINLNKVRGRLTPEDLERIIVLVPGVRTVNVVKHGELSNRQMMPLADKYPDIDFIWLIRLGRRYSLSSGATAYSTLNNGDEKNGLTSSQLAPIRYAKHLRALDLGHNRLDDISVISELPELRILILACNHITDISPLAACPHLQYVELFTNGIGDISSLAGCRELLDLNITHNRVTDLSPLDGCDKLERLWASHNPIPEEDRQRFTDKHPGCIAMFTNTHPTSDGWREHWRYFRYVKMFKTGEWQEFVPPSP